MTGGISQAHDAMDRVTKLILKLEECHGKGKLSPALIGKFQQELDKIAEKYQYDAGVGTKGACLYELQALILLAKDEQDNALIALKTAAKVSGEPPVFISEAAKRWYRNHTYVIDDEWLEEDGSEIETQKATQGYNGRIEGWLVVYALTFIIVPVWLIVDLASTSGLTNMLADTSYNDQFNGIVSYARTYDILQIASLFVLACLFFSKKKLTRNWAIIHTIFVIVGAIIFYSMMSNFYSSSGIEGSVDTQTTVTWGTFAWLFYWIFSKRVKATFVR